MKLDLSIGTARAIAQRLCDSEGVALVAPGTPGYEILRTLVIGGLQVLPGSPVTDETLEHVQCHVSFALPPVGAVKLLEMIPTAGPILASLASRVGADKPVVLIAPEVWDSEWSLLRVLAHEIGHCRAILRALREGGEIGLAMWCLGYGANASMRASLEACEYTANLSADIMFDQADPAEAIERTAETLKNYLGGDEAALTIARATLQSAADSLMSGALHGEDTPFAAVLTEITRVTGKRPLFDEVRKLWVWATVEA